MKILLCERLGGTNQYIELLAKAYQEKGHKVIFDVQNFLYSDYLPDLIHIQWPEAIYRWRHQLGASKDTINLIKNRLAFYKDARIPIVYTMHNLRPHENVTDFDEEIYNTVCSFSDIIVHHGSSSITLINENYPESANAKHIICPHGPYPVYVEDDEVSRNYYNLPFDKYIFLNFGRQKGYKGATFLEKVFKEWSNKKALLFTIGPKSEPKHYNNFIEKIIYKTWREIEPSVVLKTSSLTGHKKNIIKSVSNDELPAVVAASDIFVLGHKDGLNSGLLSLAASYGKPVVFPDIGNFREQLEGWPWKEFYEAGNIDSAIQALNRMIYRLKDIEPGNVKFDNHRWLELNSWEMHVQRIVDEVKAITK